MLKYLIIQLCDTATSFCHYSNGKTDRRLISLDDLKTGILFAMTENLNVQFLYPDYELPEEYKDAIDEVDHIDIVSNLNEDKELKENAEIVVIDSWKFIKGDLRSEQTYILRTNKEDLFKNYQKLIDILPNVGRLNIVLTDIPDFKDRDFEEYKKILAVISESLVKDYIKGYDPQTNILTDRLILNKMNNCNAGDEVVTLAPDGKFYICPAFYLQANRSDGDLKTGLKIRNPQLFKLSHAPICRKCEAYQCKRCVWLNELQTLEVNTPGREQCVVSHLERNESRRLLAKLRENGTFNPEIEIKEIDYLDPFEIITKG